MCDCPCHQNNDELPAECFCTPACIRGEPPSASDVLEAAADYRIAAQALADQGPEYYRPENLHLLDPWVNDVKQTEAKFERVLSAYIREEIRAYLEEREG